MGPRRAGSRHDDDEQQQLEEERPASDDDTEDAGVGAGPRRWEARNHPMEGLSQWAHLVGP